MILTDKQAEGLKIVKERFAENVSYTCIAGYAGTGKSTLVSHIIEELNIEEDKIAFACYTGKAALVLREKGQGAITLHKLLYQSFMNKDGTFCHIPKKKLDKDYKLIIVDEISMCPAEMWRLLLSHHIPIIAIGDPFQLPPIGNDNKVLAHPHVFLDEVMRQALESEIVQISMSVRERKPLEPFFGKDVRIFKKEEFNPEMYLWADQILCGRNDTRHKINSEIRRALNKDNEPQRGDKVICLKNYWAIMNSNEVPLINGMIGTLGDTMILEDVMFADFYPNNELIAENRINKLNMDYKLFKTGISTPYKKGVPADKQLKEFDYGYAITVHKSQGSQFNKVLLFDEQLGQDSDHFRWLYTAITRAVDKLIIII